MEQLRLGLALLSLASVTGACGGSTAPTSDQSSSSSVIALDVVSGALNTVQGSPAAWNGGSPGGHRGMLARLLDELNPIRSAWAASWTCTGASLMPAFAGPGSYVWTPPNCSVAVDGATGSSTWSGTFTLVYGASCDSTHEWIDRQSGGCTLTRTTAAGGNTRTIMTLDGNTRAVDHDTNGAGTGWDSTVTPAPSNAGVVVTCDTSGCASSRTLIINGSHLTGTITSASGTIHYDHTVTTGSSGLTVTGSGTSRSVSGTVVVQHNLTRNTAAVTFSGVTYGDTGCPFPTSGTVMATFTSGPKAGQTESTTFSATKCGDATITVGGMTTQTALTAPI